MKKDILIMCQYFHPEYVSTARLPTELAEDLVEKGFTVDAICGFPKEYFSGEKVAKHEIYNGINIRRLNYSEFNPKSKIGRLVNFLALFMVFLFNSWRLLNYRLIVVYSNPPILPLLPYFASVISKTKYIFVAYDISPDDALVSGVIKKGGVVERVMNFTNKRVYKSASRVVALATEMKEYMVNKGLLKDEQKIVVIPNWYREKRLDGQVIKNERFAELKKQFTFIVLYSGNMGTLQDIDTILHTMKRFNDDEDVLFVLTGHGNKVALVEAFIRDNKIRNAKVFGFLEGDDYSDVLNIADLCIVSLAKGIEGIGVPSKTYGYLAAGKPIVAIMSKDTDISRDLEKHQAGFTVLQGDVDGFERCIRRLVENKEEIFTCGKNARRVFETYYTRGICTQQYYEMITNL